MRDEHVLEIRLARIRVVPNDDDDDHSQDVCQVRRPEAEPEDEPHALRERCALREHERDQRGREDSERVNARTRRRDDNSYWDREAQRVKRKSWRR